jgi:hypothetical protein
VFLGKGVERDQWNAVRDALGDRPATVFAGHLHNLTRHTADGRRCFVLGPTGGVCEPLPEKALGAFHHWTMVTVEGAEAHVALVEPGSIHAEDIATPETKKARNDGAGAAAAWRHIRTRVVAGVAGHLTVRSLDAGAAAEVRQALADFEKGALGGVVLDLAGTAGGTSAEAAAVADLFLPRDQTLWTARRGGRSTPVRARADAVSSMRLVVLVDEGTSGAAELVAAALAGTGRAVVVGRATPGRTPGREAYLDASGAPVTGRGVQPRVLLPEGIPTALAVEQGVRFLEARLKAERAGR